MEPANPGFSWSSQQSRHSKSERNIAGGDEDLSGEQKKIPLRDLEAE